MAKLDLSLQSLDIISGWRVYSQGL